MPVPIKSLQNSPFAASYIFGKLKISKSGSKNRKKKTHDAWTKKIANSIAANILGYFGKHTITEANADKEAKTMKEDASKCDKKTINLCELVQLKVSSAKVGTGGTTKQKD